MFIVTFIAVFFSSIVGASLFGISLNKLALIPLELYLIIQNGSTLTFKVSSRQKTLLKWYIVASMGSLSGIIFSLFYNSQVTDVLISRAILQVFSYLCMFTPIALLVWNSNEKEKYCFCLKKAVIWTTRIQAIWGIAQFVLMQTMGFDLNSVVLGSLFGGDWTSYSNFANSSVGVVMRVTGINHDPAFLGLILVIGFILEKNLIFKSLYVVCALLALSRVALASLGFIILYTIFTNVCKSRIISYKKLRRFAKYGVGVVVLLIVFVRLYQQSPGLQDQIMRVFERFSTLSTGADGTSRHMAYPLAMLQMELFDIPILQKLVGVGNQCGGILMTYYSDSISWVGLASSMKDLGYVWTVESDIASVFLETGIIGGFLYYRFFYLTYRASKNDEKKRTLVLTLTVFGIMYNIAGGAFIQLVYIALYATDYMLTEEVEVKSNGNRKKHKFKTEHLYSVG